MEEWMKEHDACGIGALAHLKGERSHSMVDDALSVLVNLEHRGGKGLEANTGDGLKLPLWTRWYLFTLLPLAILSLLVIGTIKRWCP